MSNINRDITPQKKNTVYDVINRSDAYHSFFHLAFMFVLNGATSSNVYDTG